MDTGRGSSERQMTVCAVEAECNTLVGVIALKAIGIQSSRACRDDQVGIRSDVDRRIHHMRVEQIDLIIAIESRDGATERGGRSKPQKPLETRKLNMPPTPTIKFEFRNIIDLVST